MPGLISRARSAAGALWPAEWGRAHAMTLIVLALNALGCTPLPFLVRAWDAMIVAIHPASVVTAVDR